MSETNLSNAKYLLQYSSGNESDYSIVTVGFFNSKEQVNDSLNIFNQILDNFKNKDKDSILYFSLYHEILEGLDLEDISSETDEGKEIQDYIYASEELAKLGYIIFYNQNIFDQVNIKYFTSFPIPSYSEINNFFITEIDCMDDFFK